MLREFGLYKAGFDKWIGLQVKVVRHIRNFGVNKDFYSDVIKARTKFQYVLHQLKFSKVTQHGWLGVVGKARSKFQYVLHQLKFQAVTRNIRWLGKFKILHQQPIAHVLHQLKFQAVTQNIRWLGQFKTLHQQPIAQLATYVEQAATTTSSGRDTVLDSGAMVNSVDAIKTALATSEKVEQVTLVSGVHGDVKEITHKGRWDVPTENPQVTLSLNDTLDIPGSIYDLVAVGLLDDAGLTTVFRGGQGVVKTEAGEVLLVCPKVGGLYRLRGRAIHQVPAHVMSWDVGSLLSAHEVLQHMGMDRVRRLLNFPPATRMSPNPVCEACQYAHMRNKKTPKEALTAAPRYGYRLHSDMSRKMPNTNAFGINGIQRFQLTGDEFTNSLWVEFGQRKSDGKRLIVERIDKINNKRAPEKVAEHQTDGGKEYLNSWLNKRMAARGVTTRNSAPHCQYQNGWIENRMGNMEKGARAMMFRGNAPVTDYPYALRHWVWLNDILPHPITGLSPYEKRIGIPPPEKPETIIGKLFCLCYAKVYRHGKLERDAQKCIYMGKDGKTTGVLVRTIGGKKRGQVVRSAQLVSFDISTFPYTNMQVPRPDEIAEVDFESDSDQEPPDVNIDADGEEIISDNDDGINLNSASDTDSESEEEPDQFGDSDDDGDSLRTALEEDSATEEWDAPAGEIDGEAAWEIVEILAERMRKKGNKKVRQYKVKWAGNFPAEWLHCARVKAPELKLAWEAKKLAKASTINLVVRRC
jgi:hypothetical protein